MPPAGYYRMKDDNFVFSGRLLLLLLLAGTLIRFLFGWNARLWMEAPDQLAWQLSINGRAGNPDLIRLMHAPHEGGSLALGIASLLFRSFPLLPALSWTALLSDTIVRLIQIKVTCKIAGDRTAAWFAGWTVLSVPAMIPWATVNFGLHALASVFPFLLLYVVHSRRNHPFLYVLCGLVCAVAVSFSYDSLALLPVVVLFFVSRPDKKRIANALLFFAVCTIALLPHLWIRADMHVQTDNDILFSVRSVSWAYLLDLSRWIYPVTVWFTALPASFIVSPVHVLPVLFTVCIVTMLLHSGIIYFLSGKDGLTVRRVATGIVLFFAVGYAVSPFYGNRIDSKSYLYYRHLTYIIPLLSFICIAGFISSGNLRKALLTVWITVCGLLSIQFMLTTQKASGPAYRPAGWILVRKYGIDTRSLMDIHAAADRSYRSELITGYGWGMASLLLAGRSDTASVVKLVKSVRTFPAVYHQSLIDGVHYAFEKRITPVLDSGMLGWFDQMMNSKNNY
jgi:hypothetical protein